MLAITILFVGFFCRCLGFAEQLPDTATIQHDPLEEKLASFMRDHESTTASLLRKQDDKWASLLRDHESKTASLLRDQGTMLADLTSLLQQQDQKLSHQESLLQEQGARLSFQEALLLKQRRVILQLKNRHATDRSQSETTLPGKTSESASHDVIPRSDDVRPWEAMVSHISQRVTEMGADIQALKTQTSGDIQSLKNSNRQQDLAIQDSQSSTFVHWGSSTCSSLSHIVYSGVVGGSWFDYNGAATNYLCLTLSPVFSYHTVPRGKELLFGGEYETEDSHEGKDPVCAVCRSTLPTTVMIPGTNVCTPGWHLQYSGFLMAGNADHPAGSEYICVDSRLENTQHGDDKNGGSLLHFTVTRCGSLPCSPYVNNKVVTCAVCSK